MRRRWLELAVRAASDRDAEGLLAAALLELGGSAVFEDDGWQVTHLPEPDDVEGFLASLPDAIENVTGLAGVEIRTGWREDEDWTESWKRGLSPRRLGAHIVIRPTWTSYDLADGDIEIVIDPGVAFGTAEHGTTRGCLRLLERTVGLGERVLDVGAGSGILAIATARLGAREVVAIEGDSMACDTLADNVAANHVSAAVRLVRAWADHDMLAGQAPADGLVANIETGKLRPLLAGFRDVVRPGGWLILSGILIEEWQAFEPGVASLGFELVETDDDDVWRSGLWRLPEAAGPAG